MEPPETCPVPLSSTPRVRTAMVHRDLEGTQVVLRPGLGHGPQSVQEVEPVHIHQLAWRQRLPMFVSATGRRMLLP